MAKVILLCGKICSGKSYYVDKLKKQINAVLLSCDEMMFDFAKDGFSEEHDLLVEKIKNYLYKKTVEIVHCGANVILDFGFWSKNEREHVSQYFSEEKINYEWHYIDISDKDWQINIGERNKLVLDNKVNAYYLDEGLMSKLNSLFEEPTDKEIDVWVNNSR